MVDAVGSDPAGAEPRGSSTLPFRTLYMEDSPSLAYGAALLMRLGIASLAGSNPASSAQYILEGSPSGLWRRPGKPVG